jgi:hypothetical protein
MGQNDVGRERDQLLRVFAGIGGIAPAPSDRVARMHGDREAERRRLDSGDLSEGLALFGGGARA